MITVDEATAYLAELGLALPASVVTCLVEKANSVQACLDGAGYVACDQTLIGLYLFGMLAISSGARRIKSQGAPSGASRSFDYQDQLRQLRAMLGVLDTSGCTTALQPVDPNVSAGLWVATPCGLP